MSVTNRYAKNWKLIGICFPSHHFPLEIENLADGYKILKMLPMGMIFKLWVCADQLKKNKLA